MTSIPIPNQEEFPDLWLSQWLPKELDTTIHGFCGHPDKNDNVGRTTSGAGDINGDGYSDIIIGAPRVRKRPAARRCISGIPMEALMA